MQDDLMAILKKSKIREMSDKEKEDKIRELRLELFKEKGQADVSGTVKNSGLIKETRRTIAKIKTSQKAMELEKKKK